jgi:hypothetical protein
MSIKFKKLTYTDEQLAALNDAEIHNLRENAIRHRDDELAERCNILLVERAPKKRRTKTGNSASKKTHVVCEYHFVCQQDTGTKIESDDRFWSGVWVVDERNAVDAARYGATLALHVARAADSYRQGTVVDYRSAARFTGVRETGIEFLVQKTDAPQKWYGSGTGERGYRWAKLSTDGELLPED